VRPDPLAHLPMTELADSPLGPEGNYFAPDPRTAPISQLQSPPKPKLTPASTDERSGNALRPRTFREVVGQRRVKTVLERVVAGAHRSGRLHHMLFVGPSGTGKTTMAHVMAHELDATVYQLEAPVSADTLFELAQVMQDGDILFLDEIHQQAVGDRRGRQSATQPEVLFSVMEDFTLPTGEGVMQFPRITVVGATTDEGALPDAFVNRFPLRPRFEPYTEDDMTQIAMRSAHTLGMKISREAARMFARASRQVPREVNNYVVNAHALDPFDCNAELASVVLDDLMGVTPDGLTADMQSMLTFLLTRAKRTTGSGETRYQASVNSIATAIGKSRDMKAVQLRVEPWLIQCGYVQVLHGGRALTEAGIRRAIELNS
jgi:Holliday junction DNA helicase RuvB